MTQQEESVNFFRLVRLLVDEGYDVFRDVLLKTIQPDTLTNLVQKNIHIIKRLYQRRILNQSQYDLLTRSPAAVQPEEIDITLLCSIFRNICNISPTNGWQIPPGSNDLGLGDDIYRLITIRNTILAHTNRITAEDFKTVWTELTDLIIRSAKHCDPQKQKNVMERIQTIRTQELDPETRKLQEKLLKWKIQDEDTWDLMSDEDTWDLMSEHLGKHDEQLGKQEEKLKKHDHQLGKQEQHLETQEHTLRRMLEEDDLHIRALRRCRRQLIEELDFESIIDYMRSKEVFQQTRITLMLDEKYSGDQTRVLLDNIEKDPSVYKQFLTGLRGTNQDRLRTLILKEENEIKSEKLQTKEMGPTEKSFESAESRGELDMDLTKTSSNQTVQTMLKETYFKLIKGDEISHFLNIWGRHSKDSKLFLDWLCNFVEKIVEGVERVWVGYEQMGPLAPIFVAVVEEGNENNFEVHNGFKILQRSKGHVSDEARYVSNIESTESLSFTAEEQVSIHQCLSKHTDNLMRKHSNLLIVSASNIKSQNYGNKDASYDLKPCIVFYVHIKGIIPFNEDAFPTELDGFPVDVREGTFKPYVKASDFHERLTMGCQIMTAYGTMCSLGGFVELDRGKIACLTSCHPFATDAGVADFEQDRQHKSHLKKEVYQPTQYADFEFGKLDINNFIISEGDSSGEIGVDAALIEITKPHRYPCSGAFPDAVSEEAGFTLQRPMVFNTGTVVQNFEDIKLPCTVVKYGARTGHTIGQLSLAGPAVRVNSASFHSNKKYRLLNQLEVTTRKGCVFADEGDSGSLVFALTKPGSEMEVRALGLVAGGSEFLTIVTPIWAVLNKFNLPLKLLSFENPDPVGQCSDPANQRLERIESEVDLLKQSAETTTQAVSSLENKIDDTDRKQDERSATIKTTLDALLAIVSSNTQVSAQQTCK